jgi:hypothetical protein
MTGAMAHPGSRRAIGRPGGGFRRLAGRTLILSGTVAAVGVAFLAAMFASFAVGARESALVLGRINDTLIIVGYLLAVPAVLAFRTVARPRTALGHLLAVAGIVAIAAVVILQFLLVAGTLTFQEEVVPVSIALLVLGAWFVVVGWVGRARGVLPRGVRMGLLGATYVGYPVWALWAGRRLLGGTDRRDVVAE